MKRRFLAPVLASALVLATAVLAIAADPAKPKAKSVAITGELVDARCFIHLGLRGPKHQDCAVECAQMGIPVGIAEEKTDRFWLILGPAPKYAAWAGLTLRITGKADEKTSSIAPEKIEIQKEGKWEEVKVPETMM